MCPEVLSHAHICDLYISLSLGKCPGDPRATLAHYARNVACSYADRDVLGSRRAHLSFRSLFLAPDIQIDE